MAALAPRPKGKQPSLENRVKQLEKELEAARRACARQEALVRVTQRSLGLAALAKPKTLPPATNGKASQVAQADGPCARRQRRRSARRRMPNAGNPEPPSLQPTAPSGGAEEARP